MPNTPTYILYHGKATSKGKAGKKIWTRIQQFPEIGEAQ
jgi:hypothetical protein